MDRLKKDSNMGEWQDKTVGERIGNAPFDSGVAPFDSAQGAGDAVGERRQF